MKSDKLLQELQMLNCVKVLQRGETLLYPTDTIWGLGCDATDREMPAHRPEQVPQAGRF